MKFTIIFSRKVRTKAYETMEVGMTAEFDDSQITPDEAFRKIRDTVNKWIDEERDRILRDEIPR